MSALSAEPEIILDLSRLLSRLWHVTPTGVDRCEMAYARGLLAAVPDRLSFAAVHPSGVHGRLRRDHALSFLDWTENRWNRSTDRSTWEINRFAMRALIALRPHAHRPSGKSKPFYVQASPNNLSNPRLIANVLQKTNGSFVCLLHDLIPLQFPEYARVGGARQHRTRIETMLINAAGIVCNSHATLAALRPWMDKLGRHPTAVAAHLGTHHHAPSGSGGHRAEGDRPYFVCVGTIEPRKNHLLLLNLWRQMAEDRGTHDIPKLILIGRRGWENEQVVDMLERCPALRECVEEQGRLSDDEVSAVLAGARALLLPSFAEGYGMPVTEAMAIGVPILCSDLPALREAGAGIPDYLDPLDGRGWRAAIEDFARPDSVRRAAQIAAMSDWTPPRWADHIDTLLGLLEDLRVAQ
jgi:glycosyltransferase involved in cell wall biosynthesis